MAFKEFAKITVSWASNGIGFQFVDDGLKDFPFFVGEVTRVPDSRLNRFFSPGKLRDYIAATKLHILWFKYVTSYQSLKL